MQRGLFADALAPSVPKLVRLRSGKHEYGVGSLTGEDNLQPRLRAALHGQGQAVHIACLPGNSATSSVMAPFLALEGRYHVVLACAFQPMVGAGDAGGKGGGLDGGSVIVDAAGTVVAGPLMSEGVLHASLGLDGVLRARAGFDYSGHSSTGLGH